MEQDHAFLDFTVKALVDNQEAVVITRSVDEMGVLLMLTVAPEDMGKIIGKDGNIAKAIRTLLRVVGMKHNARVNLKINEPSGGKRFQEDSKSLEDVLEGIN
ncbi:KH domain-containing protein [Patescibacteria group bacterium]|nr:KH domain-containing protein [Patescibacteria group bacterium]MBU2159088.1 KH domain-containing protein [Patescibacteria group bacterium]MBU2220517.1 KH domain-containing protein [Patescibacteria group bacterium]